MKNPIMSMLTAVLGLVCAAHAAPLVQEGFDYPNGLFDGSQTNGVGFATNAWTTTTGCWITNDLKMLGIVSSGRGAFHATTAGNSERPTVTYGGGSTFYVSMVINTSGANSDRTGCDLRLSASPWDGPLFGRVGGSGAGKGWGMFAGANGALGISNSKGSYLTWTAVTNAADSFPHLVVVKFDFAANAVKFFLDPVTDGTEPTPSATLVTGGDWTVNLDSDTFNKIRFFRGSTQAALDELRIGTTWADVTPPAAVNSGIHEGFGYALGAINGTQAGGIGFDTNSHWGASGADIVAGLSYPGLILSGSGALKPTVGGFHYRPFSNAVGQASFYMSMLINANSTETERFGYEFRDHGTDGVLFGKVSGGWGMMSGPAGKLGISNSDGSFKIWTGVSNTVNSATHLFVVKVDREANAIKIFVNPKATADEPAPSATLTTGGKWTVNLNNQMFDGFRLYHTATGQTTDELHIGKTWREVVPCRIGTAIMIF